MTTIFGIILVILAVYHLFAGRLDFDYIEDWFSFDITPGNAPITFWTIVLLELIVGLILIYMGLTEGADSVPIPI